MILKNISVLYGTNLQFKEKINVQITKNLYRTISPKITSTKLKIHVLAEKKSPCGVGTRSTELVNDEKSIKNQ